MQQNKSQVGLYCRPQGTRACTSRAPAARSRSTSPPMASIAVHAIGSQTFPRRVGIRIRRGIKGQPIPWCRKTTDLLIPECRTVIEGIIVQFGDVGGPSRIPAIRTAGSRCPLVDSPVHYRTKPILTNALMGGLSVLQQSGFFSVIRSAKIWDDLESCIPHRRRLCAYGRPAASHDVISLEQRLCRPRRAGAGACGPGSGGATTQMDHRGR